MKIYPVSIYLLSISSIVSSLSSQSGANFSLTPSCIVTNSLSQSYPVTILNKLFSSVPKREKAINDITLNFGHCSHSQDKPINDALTVLVGRSASGKSTLLRIISQIEQPISGTLIINGRNCFTGEQNEKEDNIHIPKPIIIDSKPDCFDSKSTLFQRLVDTISDIPDVVSTKDVANGYKETIIVEFAQILGFTRSQLYDMHPSDLTPSQQYMFGLAQGCLQSSLRGVDRCVGDSKNGQRKEVTCTSISIPGPILLLDELLDKETSDVARKVGAALLNLTKHGGVIIAATHRPEYLSDVAQRIVTLSSGKVLSQEYP